MIYRGDFMMIRKRRRRRSKKAIFIIVFIFTAVSLFEIRLNSVCSGIAELEAQSLATEAINTAVYEALDELDISSDKLDHVVLSSDNKVIAVNSDTALANKLKNAVTLKIQNGISNIKNRRIDVPLGVIIGGELFSGLGPSIAVYISLSGNVKTDFEDSFESGGINQTVHKLSMKIDADLNIITSHCSSSTAVKTSVLLGETVIVGDVPEGILNPCFNTQNSDKNN